MKKPYKLLDAVSPIPKVEAKNVRKRAQNIATVLTAVENLEEKRIKKQKKETSTKKETSMKKVKSKRPKEKVKTKIVLSSESENGDFSLDDEESGDSLSSECAGCGEKYSQTKKKEDWVQCLHCSAWFHEGCSKYTNLCDLCGKILSKKRGK